VEAPVPDSGRRRARFRTTGLILLAVVLVASIATVVLHSGSSRSIVPPHGALLGAYVQAPRGATPGDAKDTVTAFERGIGRQLAIDQHFYPWMSPFPTWRERWDLAEGRIPMITWGRFSTAAVLSGSEDELIRERARGVRDLGSPVLLRWAGEMDAQHWAGIIGSPDDFISAWQHVRSLFDEEGAGNAQFVWCPNASAFTTGRAQRYYPGDDQVDWICADGYNWSPLVPGGRPGGPWTPFPSIFSSFYRWGLTTGKPMLIGETGAQEDTPGRKAAWITDMGEALRGRFPEIKALVYFDAVSSSNQGGTFDWKVDTSPDSQAAFAQLATLPYFRPSLPS
jgi:hypothetical protein